MTTTTKFDWPAFPVPSDGATHAAEPGMSLRQYVAIKLRVPDSGDECLDAMIRESLRDYFAAKAMQAIVSQARINPRGDYVADDCLLQHWNAPKHAAITAYQFADAMLAARGVTP